MNYSDRWPIVTLDEKEFYLKYSSDFSQRELRLDMSMPFNPSISCKIAQAVGYPYHPESFLHFQQNQIASAEEKVGDDLSKPPFNFRWEDTHHALSPTYVKEERYKSLLERFGPPFVQGDVYRIFSIMGDSSFPHNMAYDGEQVRWVDFGDAFSSESFGYYFSDVIHYFGVIGDIWKALGQDVLQGIKDLDDDTIEEAVHSVMSHPEVARLASDPPKLCCYSEDLQSYTEKVISFVIYKREMMRTLD